MIPSKGRNLCRSITPDILSDLPNNAIDVILMRLPCKEAVRTSILSKRWRYHWCRLTELTLDWSLWKTENDLLNPTDKFTDIISQILTLHEGPLTKFTLNVVNLESCPEIDFIYFDLRNSIQHLVLHLPFRKIYEMPSSLFTCSQLRHLSLCYCSIHHPSAFQGFDQLVSLKIYLKIEVLCARLVYNEADSGIQESLELEYFSGVTFNYLREVELASFGGTTPEMQLIKILLAKSPVLAKMYIDPVILIGTESEILAELVKFHHADPKHK